jgi:23S rRNA pseudouridine2605 synthase
VGRDVGRRLRAGVRLDDKADDRESDRPVTVDAFRVVQTQGRQAIVEIVLHEGRKHVVRRVLAQVGHPVTRLVRTAIGPVRLGGQRAGTLRPLTGAEVAALYRAAEAPPTRQ